jgi:tetratricopeptide (TPR) repeat protein
MKKRSAIIITLLIVAFGYSQEIPVLKVADKQLGLSSLSIEVEIVGNMATTTYDMLFYNPTSSILEGELSFPLGEGHTVSRFALDINGKLRDAVVVDKELGRIAFEQVVRRRVDPALLEKGTGNNYKARIYPIPANGYKRVLVAYEQELIYRDAAQYFNLPLNFKNKLANFNLEIVVFDQKDKPVIEKGDISGLEFSNWEKNYRTTVAKKEYIPNRSLLIKIPVPIDTEKTLQDEGYFYLYKTLSKKNRIREIPNKIEIFWDASLSMKGRNLEKELILLNDYFRYIKDVNVCFVSFSNTILSNKEFIVKDGNWDDLKMEINQTIYDGGTSYDFLGYTQNDADFKVLFSDGITPLSNATMDLNQPVFIVNSLIKSNHFVLNQIAESSNGAYINLLTKSSFEAFHSIKYESYKFLGIDSDSKTLEVYPKAPKSVLNDFSLSGKNAENGDTIILNFGYGDEIIECISVKISASQCPNRNVKRIWAQKKLEDLMLNTKKNKELIVKLGTEYSLVTDYTSLIVLEDVRDYFTYRITPPDELLEEYNRLLATMENKMSRNGNLEEEIPITQSLSPPPPPPTAPEIIEVVEDEVEVEETIIQSSETSQRSEIMHIDEIEEVNDEEIIDIPFSVIENTPVYPGCEGTNREKKDCFSEEIRDHIKEHFNAQLSNNLNIASGTQRISTLFTIDRQGNIINIRVRAPHIILEKEVIRILKLLPQMTPGKQRGSFVDVVYALPILFSVDDVGQIVVNGQDDTLNSNSVSANERSAPLYNKYSGNLTIKKRSVNESYIIELDQAKNREEAYEIYLKQREEVLNTPAYYVDVSNYFKDEYKDEIYSSRIVSNIAEIDFDNYELLKVFAYQLQVNGQDELALIILTRILELRPEDSQSYRDLALAYENLGKYQEAFDLFNQILTGEIYKNKHRRVFKGIENIAKNEIGHLIKKYKNELNLNEISKELINGDGYDVRVLVDWNHNDTDIDLHIIDPNLEECFYSHNKTVIGGSISKDMTQGFGPEEFTLKNAIKGDYYVKIKYFGDRYQKVENPTFMKVTMFKNYGFKNESKEIKIIRLTKRDDKEVIAKLSL